MIRRILYFSFIIFLAISQQSIAGEVKDLLDFEASDRVLILAPHPDDEAIGTAGVMQRALKAGAKVKVVILTNGDNNELAFIVYEKRLTFKKGEFLHMGGVRKSETIKAMNSLGLSESDITFLGYPDYGTMEILTKYWGKVKPYRSMFPRQIKVPYSDALSPNAPYVGESILNDLKTVLTDFKPNKVFVSHPADSNRDHRALYLFLQIALMDLENSIKRPEIVPYIIHVVRWPMPRGYHPELELDVPKGLDIDEISWQRLRLTDEEIEKKWDAIKLYKSQIKYAPSYLVTFARRDELFGDFSLVHLKRQKDASNITWQDMEISESMMDSETPGEENNVSALSYALEDGNLLIRIILKKSINKNFGISIFLLGYNKKIDFPEMPKINLIVNMSGLHVKEKKQTLFIKGVQLKTRGKELTIKVPLLVLGEPQYILSCAKTRASDLSLDEAAWRVLSLE